jgi:2-polyprenyl-3-methyl-5-hydroxy-6-metoxy-1,4-benzoquinol methylase
MTADTTELTSHFAFGENWADFSASITEENVRWATDCMAHLLGADLAGKSFLDIGCGSGLHAVAALNLGAGTIMAIDIDPKSVETTKSVLSQFSLRRDWQADTVSVLSNRFDALGKFDIVYSWGVLHHTGQMRAAITKAAQAVKPGGILAIAIYTKTSLCGFWRHEKRIYSRAPRWGQAIIRGIFHTWKALISVLVLIKNGRLEKVNRIKVRGMAYKTDVHDWLGGYPYESATPEEIFDLADQLGLKKLAFFPVPGRRRGLLGSGCDEYVFARK